MKLLAGEYCDAGLVEALRHEGHDVTCILEMRPGATDTEVLQQARRDERTLLTVDKDFGGLVYRLRRPVPGLILLRFAPEEQTLKEQTLKAPRLCTLLEWGSERLEGALCRTGRRQGSHTLPDVKLSHLFM